MKIRVKNTSDTIRIKRRLHDEAIVISGSLTVDYLTADINALIAEALETAARDIGERGGIVGHIKAGITAESSGMISVTDEKAMIKESPSKRARITLAAIVFFIDPKEAEDIIRQALTAVTLKTKKPDRK